MRRALAGGHPSWSYESLSIGRPARSICGPTLSHPAANEPSLGTDNHRPDNLDRRLCHERVSPILQEPLSPLSSCPIGNRQFPGCSTYCYLWVLSSFQAQKSSSSSDSLENE